MPIPIPILLLTITLPEPSIYWHQSTEGKHRLRCAAQEEYAGSLFFLYQGSSREPVAVKKALPTQSEVIFAAHTMGPSEQFHCRYEIWEGGKAILSPLSSPTNITEDHYPKPSIAVSPGNKVVAGQDWTIHCWASFAGVSFVLYQAREYRIEVTSEEDSCTAKFSLRNVTVANADRYTCYYHSITEPIVWSNASDPVELIIIDANEVPCYEEVLVDTAGKYRVNCTFPSHTEGWLYLYQDGQLLGSHPLSPDFTMLNSLRLGIGFSLLILAFLFVANACREKMYQEY
ncbi:hypothetical protein JRQ81_005854 [Phrynocephalus forsythii]|uniref:C19orf38 Ig domain-containing protein n=1 Tax=Phrynocephalus forsythii TaxID=171643 RepID=A0A9Q1AVV9_9SAUR|nr:hypothetical protein JRQ81_005854 [Phrynocephalus forsythii]